MKRIILSLAAVLMLSPSAIYSQTVSIDKAGLLRKIENSNEDIANAKKSEKVATWLNRGKLFTDAATEISKNVYENMPRSMADLMLGKATEEAVAVNGRSYTKLTYPAMAVYVDESDAVKAWEINDVIYEGALEEAIAAYGKAYELDANKKNAEKINTGIQSVFDEYYKQGGNYFVLGQFAKSGEAFEKALKLVENPAYIHADDKVTQSLAHDTGLAYYFANDFSKAIEYFTKAENLGYDREGEIYYLLYHAYRGLANGDVEVLKQVEPMLDRGFTKYPDNANVIEAMTDLYVVLGKDPQDLVPIVRQAVDNDPGNPVLWNGLGRIYERLGNFEGSIAAFGRVADLMPNNYAAYYSLGVMYFRNAEKLLNEVNEGSYASQNEYDAAKVIAFDEYGKAIVPLEKAHEINPADVNTLELLRSITFRLRENPDMAAKNARYTELLNQQK